MSGAEHAQRAELERAQRAFRDLFRGLPPMEAAEAEERLLAIRRAAAVARDAEREAMRRLEAKALDRLALWLEGWNSLVVVAIFTGWLGSAAFALWISVALPNVRHPLAAAATGAALVAAALLGRRWLRQSPPD